MSDIEQVLERQAQRDIRHKNIHEESLKAGKLHGLLGHCEAAESIHHEAEADIVALAAAYRDLKARALDLDMTIRTYSGGATLSDQVVGLRRTKAHLESRIRDLEAENEKWKRAVEQVAEQVGHAADLYRVRAEKAEARIKELEQAVILAITQLSGSPNTRAFLQAALNEGVEA